MRYLLAFIFILSASMLASAGTGILGKIGRGTPYGFTGKMPITGGIGSGSAPPLVSCASTGIFDLSNVCNDVYFIGALK